jgi:hypothetical protein
MRHVALRHPQEHPKPKQANAANASTSAHPDAAALPPLTQTSPLSDTTAPLTVIAADADSRTRCLSHTLGQASCLPAGEAAWRRGTGTDLQ